MSRKVRSCEWPSWLKPSRWRLKVGTRRLPGPHGHATLPTSMPARTTLSKRRLSKAKERVRMAQDARPSRRRPFPAANGASRKKRGPNGASTIFWQEFPLGNDSVPAESLPRGNTCHILAFRGGKSLPRGDSCQKSPRTPLKGRTRTRNQERGPRKMWERMEGAGGTDDAKSGNTGGLRDASAMSDMRGIVDAKGTRDAEAA